VTVGTVQLDGTLAVGVWYSADSLSKMTVPRPLLAVLTVWAYLSWHCLLVVTLSLTLTNVWDWTVSSWIVLKILTHWRHEL